VDSAEDLQLAFDTADLAADLALAYFESGVSATLKADGTPVTEADRAVERLFRETLSAARPEDALLGEELGQLGQSDRVWIIDPRRDRKIICFFAAVPVQAASQPAIRPEEPEVVGVAWRDPLSLDLERVSAFLHPLIRAERSRWAGGHVHFRMEHRQLADGSFAPVPA